MATVKSVGNTNINNAKLGTPSNPKDVYFVEPLEGESADNKDLVMYIDLTASKKSRTVAQITQNSLNIKNVNGNKEINLIGYRRPNGNEKSMTTDWSYKPNLSKSKILGTQTELSQNVTDDVFEGFGVESIDINITAMNPPVVTIKFIDTRGGGLFDQETFDPLVESINSFQNSTSPYSIFFEMPPPLFYLTIKGYYGNPVQLCLYMTKWDGNFNSETGNFEMTANFLGYTFAFLQDIRLGHLIGAGNSDEGKKKLIKVSSVPSADNTTFPILTLDDLAVRFQRITIKRQEEQKNSEEFQKLRVINEQIKFVNKFKSYLGSASSPVLINNISGSNLSPSILKVNRQQIFFRDVGIIAKDDSTLNNYNTLSNLVKEALTKYEELRTAYPADFYNQGFLDKSDIQFPEKLSENGVDKVLWKQTLDETLTEVNRLIKENEDYVTLEATQQIFTAKTQNNWKVDSGFYIINLRKTRESIEKKLDNLLEYKKLQEQIIENKFNREITDILGFQPSIKNIIGILCNNIEMFLEMIYDVGLEAQRNNGEGTDARPADNPRYVSLGSYTSDSVEKDINIYPFPKIVDNNSKEVYIGNIKLRDENVFPEIKFINLLTTGLSYSIKQLSNLNQSLKNIEKYSKLESFPNNTYDIGISPYTALEELPTENTDGVGTINKEIVVRIIRRAFISYAMSKYKDTALFKIGDLEAINYFETLINDASKDYFNQLSVSQTDENSLLQLSLEYGVISDAPTNANNYKFESQLYTNSFEIDSIGTTNSNTRTWDRVLNLKEEIKNSLKLNDPGDPEIKKFTSPKRTEKYINRFFDKDKVFTNKSYLTLATFKSDGLKDKILLGKDLKSANLLEGFNFNDLQSVSNGITTLYLSVPPTPNNFQIQQPFTKTSLYINSTDYGKAYLILSSLLFETDKVLDDEIGSDYTKIIRLPYFYLLWLGANSYRKNNGEIIAFNTEYPSVPTTQFYNVTENKSYGITNDYLISLFEKEFKNWVESSDSSYFEIKDKLNEYLNSDTLNENRQKALADSLSTLMFKEVDLLIYDSTWMRLGLNGKDETIPKESLSQYLTNFMNSYNAIYKNKRGTNTVVSKTEEKPNQPVVNDPDIKLACYTDVKQVYDNWIAGNTNSKTFNCCKASSSKVARETKLIDLFKFVDKFRNASAGDAIININSFNDLINKKNISIYSFMSKVITDSFFMHFNLPIYLEFNNPEEVKKIFEPQLVFEKNLISGPSFLCVYNGPPSTNLKSNNNYKDDSFKFTDEEKPSAVFEKQGNQEKTNLVAFNVNYGSQKQSIFKNVSVGTQESKQTGEYMTLLSNYVLGTGESKPLIKDNSVYPMMRNRSYTSSVQMLGNMMIQPQMYFQLNNIPFFSGAYMIMNVSHQVRANNIYTTFKGVRQNRSPVSIITKPTSFLSFQYDGGIYSASQFTNITTQDKDLVAEAQSQEQNPVIAQEVLDNYRPTVGSTLLRPYSTGAENHLGIDIGVDSENTYINSVGKEGTILYYDRDKGTLVIKHDPEKSDDFTYYTGYFGLKDMPLLVQGGRISKFKYIGKPSIYSGVTIEQSTTIPTQPNIIKPNYTFEITPRRNGASGFDAKVINNGVLIGIEGFADFTEQEVKNELNDRANNKGFNFGATHYISYEEYKKQISGIKPTENIKKTFTKYYYHYEIKRSKELVENYDQYRRNLSLKALNGQQFAPNLKVNIADRSLHNDSIY
jgi:hypothetical protein